MMNILYLLPKNILSRFVGFLMHQSFGPAKNFLIHAFAKMYSINLNEADKPYTEYKSIGDFFIRKIKMETRPLGQAKALHPADSVISQIGLIRYGKLIQAKGKSYTVNGLTKDPQALNKWDNGLFATYYLCPTDYHRVHSPVTGDIIQVTLIPGKLWPVNSWSVENISDLFAVNERVVVEIKTEWGSVAVVFVGATNVGKISLNFEESIISNQGESEIRTIQYKSPIKVKKGDELGMFHMGSTVVMCYPKTFAVLESENYWQQFKGQAVKVRDNFSQNQNQK